MNFIEDDKFNEYVKSYKNLPLTEKKQIVEKQIEELLVVLNELNERNNIESKVLFNREILDLKKQEATESDFVEAMFVYIYSIKELLASFVNNIKQ